MAYDTHGMQAHPGDKQREGPIRESRRCASQRGHIAATALRHVAARLSRRQLPGRRTCLLEHTFEHQENFSKIFKSIIMVYYHLFFSFTMTHCANIT